MRSRFEAIALGVLLLGACKEPGGSPAAGGTAAPSDVGASVDCKAEDIQIDCQVKLTTGGAAAKICWDLEFACETGGPVSKSVCQQVAAQGTEHVRFDINSMKGSGDCDKIKGPAKVSGIKASSP
ncbi:MAG: hypothetical protein HY744_14165 [Deltaproteobacteria bacterium]|nr:hypothetical protein [Deltaproteobacteria bacterium]